MFDVIVIGGGAAGMMAAGAAASVGKKVLLLEKNGQLGNKLRITGGGRCNITNNQPDLRQLLSYYGQAKPALFSAFSQFSVTNTFQFFESCGLPLITQDRGRVFPRTQQAVDVVRVLEQRLKRYGVEVWYNCKVFKLQIVDGQVASVETSQGLIKAKSVILASGGVSHPETGSTGDGFKWLVEVGHTVKQPTPTIVPVRVAESWIGQLAGISLPEVKVIFYVDGKKRISKTGPLLFTHFGLSGPMILNTAGQIGDWLEEGVVTTKIDLFSKIEFSFLEKQILALFEQHKNKQIGRALKVLLPTTLLRVALDLSGIERVTKVHSITKEQRKALVHVLKGVPVTIAGLMGLDRAVVADGGVDLAEIDTRTMRSKLVSNLYVVGDMLHINRPSGGYSLQLCWTTGYVAGSSA